MSDAPEPELELELEGTDSTYAPVDEIAGTLHVSDDSTVRDAPVVVTLEWYTHGFGNGVREVVAERTFDGEEGREAAEPLDFSFEAPSGPFTHHGRYLNIDWLVRARVQTHRAAAPEQVAGLTLESGPAGEFDVGDPEEHLRKRRAAWEPGSVEWTWTGVGLVLWIVPLVLFAVGEMAGPDGLPVVFYVFGGVSALAGCGFLYRGLKNWLATTRLGDFVVLVTPVEVAPGERVRCSVEVTPNGLLDLNDITATLVGRERATSGEGTDATTRTEAFHREEVRIDETVDARIRPGETEEFEVEIEIPSSAPHYTFHAEDNHVEWHVEFHVDIPAWPDLVHVEPLLVRPSEVASTGPAPNERARPEPEGRSAALESEEDYEIVW